MTTATYYITMTIMALTIHTLVNYAYITQKDRLEEDREYRRFLIVVTVYLLNDIIWGISDYFNIVGVKYLTSMIYSTTMALSVVCCCRYVISFLKMKKSAAGFLNFLGVGFFVAAITTVIINYFFPIYFWYSADGEYRTGTLRYVAMIFLILMFCVISTLAFFSIGSATETRYRNKTIYIFGVVMTISLLAQLFFPMIPLYSCGLIIGSIIIRIYIHEDERKKQMEMTMKLNVELEIAKKEAEEANKAKTAFLNNMSHDIRTPMNAILGFTELMGRRKDDPNIVNDYLQKIKNSGEYLLSIINNVLDLARIDSGKVTLNEDLCDIIDHSNTIDIFESLIKQKNIHFESSHSIEHRYVYIDKTKVYQIMINLISNALKYTPNGGTVTMRLDEIPSEREGYMTVKTVVKDNGIGMSEEFQKHIFDNFTREHNSTESKVIGTGLGMSIVKKLIYLMGGTIEVNSELGKGTTVTVILSHKIANTPNYLESSKKENNIEQLENKRILLAEDNELNAEIAIALLKEMGVEVEHAHDGVECINMLLEAEAGYYDMILMDIQMPNLDGYLATMKIRKLNDKEKAGITIIAMTANAFDEDKQKAIDAGMSGHLAKPINLEELSKVLRGE